MTGEEMIRRYIHEVIRRVPRAQREEAERELQELIRDMLEERGSEECVEEVLEELGDPAKFAQKYRGGNRFLIGPEFYDNYLWVLRIVLLCVGGGLLVVTLGDLIFAESLADSMFGAGETVAGIPGALLSAFGAVTLIFAVMEHLHIRVDIKQECAEWHPSMLPAAPSKQARISRGDTVVSLVFTAVFATLILFVPQLFALWHVENGSITTVPLFNSQTWNTVAAVWLISLLIGLIRDSIKLVKGRWCIPVLVAEIVCGLAQLALLAVVFFALSPWNPDFFAQATQPTINWPGDVMRIIVQTDVLFENGGLLLSQAVFAILSMCTFFDLASAVYKTLRYGRE